MALSPIARREKDIGVALRICYIRHRLGYNQARFAKLLGIKQSTLENLRGWADPPKAGPGEIHGILPDDNRRDPYRRGLQNGAATLRRRPGRKSRLISYKS